MTSSGEGEAQVLVVALGGTLLGQDPLTGKILWKRDVHRFGNPLALVVTPTAIYAAGLDQLVRLDYPSGELRWAARVPRGRNMLLLQGQRLYVGGAGEVACFTLDGKLVWHEPFKGQGRPAVALGFPGNVVQADYE